MSGQAPPPPTGAADKRRASKPARALYTSGGGGFALHEAFWRRVAGVSDVHVVQSPPIGGGEAALFDVSPAISHAIPL